MLRTTLAGVSLAALMTVPAVAAPVDLTFAGNFSQDDDVLVFDFNLAEEREITVFSSSWQSPENGGFDPILSLWTADGELIESQDDGEQEGSREVNGITYDFGVWDTFFTQTLAAGDYLIAITQYDNFPDGDSLAEGFERGGNANFTFDEDFGGATQAMFNGVWDDEDPRTSFWRFHLLNVDEAEVVEPPPSNDIPEPAGIALLGFGLGGLALARRRRRS